MITDSKTLKFWLILIGIAFGIVLITAGLQEIGIEVPYVSDLLTLIGVGGGAGTTRNIITDGGPRIAQSWQEHRSGPGMGPPA